MGLILVFDLDETIANTIDPIVLNYKILRILQNCKSLRGRQVDGIFLLTNNSDPEYISSIDDSIKNMVRSVGKYTGGENGFPIKDYFFDYIMALNHPFRKGFIKSVEEIKYMLDVTGVKYVSDTDVLSRTYFFDDQLHVIKKELENAGYADNYIHIKPGFTGKDKDYTNYEPINDAVTAAILYSIKGGRRKLRKATRKYRKTYKV